MASASVTAASVGANWLVSPILRPPITPLSSSSARRRSSSPYSCQAVKVSSSSNSSPGISPRTAPLRSSSLVNSREGFFSGSEPSSRHSCLASRSLSLFCCRSLGIRRAPSSRPRDSASAAPSSSSTCSGVLPKSSVKRFSPSTP